ncbi:MAG: hypothetical protein ABSE49_33995 [Polyangiaceae bacterium]
MSFSHGMTRYPGMPSWVSVLRTNGGMTPRSSPTTRAAPASLCMTPRTRSPRTFCSSSSLGSNHPFGFFPPFAPGSLGGRTYMRK